jgi:hypothetical protein
VITDYTNETKAFDNFDGKLNNFDKYIPSHNAHQGQAARRKGHREGRISGGACARRKWGKKDFSAFCEG